MQIQKFLDATFKTAVFLGTGQYLTKTDLYELNETFLLTNSGKLGANGVYNYIDSIYANFDPIGLSILTLTPLGLDQQRSLLV